MNTPIRFDLNVNSQKLIAAIKVGLNPKDIGRKAVWWQRVEQCQLGGELMDIYEAPLRGSHLSVHVLGIEHKLDMDALRRGIQILADRYPDDLAQLLEGRRYLSGAADRFVQCALFGEVRFE